MSFQSKTIANAIQELNTATFVPAIQREFVWTEEQIIQLFDSILRDYPIGSLLFWRVRGDLAQEQIKYKFVQHYVTDPVHPESLGNVHHRNPEVEDYEDVPNGIQLVLDGQQRLTALYIGLQGTLTTKQKHRHRTNPNAWDRKQLYLNVLSDPDEISDDDLKMRYEFEFKTDPEMSEAEYWYRVKDILELNEYDGIHDITEEIDAELSEQEIHHPTQWKFINKNLTSLYRAVHERSLINYDEKEEDDLGKVLDMFIRTNRGGTQLSTSEVLLSIATAQWANGSGADAINAREEITEFIDDLNRRRQDAGFSFDIDFALRNLLMCSDLPTSESVRHFNQSNLQKMKQTWTDNGKMQQAVRNAVDLVVDFGLDSRSLTSRNALVPIAYFFYTNDNPNLEWSSGHEEISAREEIHQWLCTSILNGTFSVGRGAIERARSLMQTAPAMTFPGDEIHRELRSDGRVSRFDRDLLELQLDSLEYGSRKIFSFLSLLYHPGPARSNTRHDVDHIFPQDQFDTETLVQNYGLDSIEAERYTELKDRPGNLQLLNENENRSKSGQSFLEWLKSQDESYFEKHHIPQNEDLHQLENFPEFIEKREELIIEDLLDKFGPEETQDA
ncbi:DUF262 domain-containing protein [Natronobeatus ordinarius]|uniref:DUF262 domain-containing protein n=1 Tax=Natronobeatus ordinarius TaxID=2963433 RepID=UPI0020CF6B51|nr:DUF262 domain-containing protein [Natronobeatus ordinarius]